PKLGIARFLLLYFFCGIASGIASLIFNLYTISAGASGALFGLYGFLLGTELIGSYNDRQRLPTVLINFLIFVAVSAYFTTLFAVDLAGHVGGCVAGLLLALLHYKFQWLTESKNLAAGVIVLSILLFFLPKDQLNYYRLFHRVLETEKQTNRIYRESNDDVQIKDSLITIVPKWDSIYAALHRLRRVPAKMIRDTSTLSSYVQLRKKDAEYRIALMELESYVYMDSLEIVNTKMDSLPPFDFNLNFDLPDEVEEKDSVLTTPPALRTKRIFYDANWKVTDDPSSSTFYRVGTIDSLDRWQGQVIDYYRNGDIQMKGKYLDGMKNGIFIYYSEGGKYSSAGRYVKEDAVGKWETYHWNGTLHSEVYYNQGAFTRNVWDSLGRAQVVNGKGKSVSWHLNGQISEEGNYESGRREGDWFGYHQDGKPYYHEFYRDNRLIRGASEDKDGKRYVYDQLSLYPFPIIGMTEYKKYLDKNMRKPDSERHQSGIVKVIFDVGVDGSIWDFVVIESLSPAHDREAVRLIKEGPAWRSGLHHGHVKLPSQGYVEVVF
ncbi:MAG: hypothetical protein C0490_05795, partial [Marivirga sp.]|nr:hypothetical protein [Marivirga sp.]